MTTQLFDFLLAKACSKMAFCNNSHNISPTPPKKYPRQKHPPRLISFPSAITHHPSPKRQPGSGGGRGRRAGENAGIQCLRLQADRGRGGCPRSAKRTTPNHPHKKTPVLRATDTRPCLCPNVGVSTNPAFSPARRPRPLPLPSAFYPPPIDSKIIKSLGIF